MRLALQFNGFGVIGPAQFYFKCVGFRDPQFQISTYTLRS